GALPRGTRPQRLPRHRLERVAALRKPRRRLRRDDSRRPHLSQAGPTMITRQHYPSIDVVHCLVVDDIEENLIALTALLRAENVQIHTATSGAEALDLLLRHDMALALLDVQMPEMDGFQLAEIMRGTERTRHVPIIFVTAGMRDQVRM